VDAGYLPAAERVGRALGVPRVFLSTHLLGPPRMVQNGDTVRRSRELAGVRHRGDRASRAVL
jgi:hypothetical protein